MCFIGRYETDSCCDFENESVLNCGKVYAAMNELQKVEFALLKEFVRICDLLHLTYYLVCGTALGAAKYNGFIPWDDDIDVALPRPDYEVFCQKAQDFLPEHICLQNYRTQSAYPRIYSKLRDSTTTYIEKTVAHIPMNHGIFIDVFPLDGYPIQPKEAKRLEKYKRKQKLKIECVFDVDYGWLRNMFFRLERMVGYHKRTAALLENLSNRLSQYPTSTSSVWCNHGNWQGKLEYAPREQYGEGAWATFEGLKVRIPERYDEYLTQKYGDWRADLPPEQQVGHHYYTVMDTKKPYTEYVGMQQSHQ